MDKVTLISSNSIQDNTNTVSETNSKVSIVSKIFDLRGKFAIIGLTGRTGSGCSTVANILCTEEFSKLALQLPDRNGEQLTNDERKYQIYYDYLKENWIPAIKIKVTLIIVWICMLSEYDSLINDLEKWLEDNIKTGTRKKQELLLIFKKIFENNTNTASIRNKAKEYFKYLNQKDYKYIDDIEKIVQISEFLEKKLPQHYNSLKTIIDEENHHYTIEVFQILGNFIRDRLELEANKQEKVSIIELVNLLIKFYRHKNKNIEKKEKTIIIIDALRNPYEILFMRERYSSFYTISVNTPEEERQRRLYTKSYTRRQVEECDKTEYPNKPSLQEIYLRQNIEKCNEISDIHLFNGYEPNPSNLQLLTKQIALYMSLILHPGLVPPSNEERTMQIAYTAKYNSGCLSRQVGAVITNDQFAIKAIGWNDVPEGQTPCILRNSLNVLDAKADKSAYSNYELYETGFQEKLKNKITCHINPMSKDIKERLHGRHVPYCFKDVYNNKEHGENNQVHTRSLHAEENAFLQISKHGGQGIQGGKLFTTASLCELCAKKAYQLGIKEIYYIDLYPGISKKHILENGIYRPKMKLFHGAIGRAYIHLYQPILSYKDEIRELLNPNQQ